jgi:tetratricopeptide (TPR) repeat protein
MRNGRYFEAIDIWRRFLDAGGDEHVARGSLAAVYVRLLDYGRAEEELRRALEADPGDERLTETLNALRQR